MPIVTPDTPDIDLGRSRIRPMDTYAPPAKIDLGSDGADLGKALASLGGEFASLGDTLKSKQDQADGRNIDLLAETQMRGISQDISSGIPGLVQQGLFPAQHSPTIMARVNERVGELAAEKAIGTDDTLAKLLANKELQTMNPDEYERQLQALKDKAVEMGRTNPSYGQGYLKRIDQAVESARHIGLSTRTDRYEKLQKESFVNDALGAVDKHTGPAGGGSSDNDANVWSAKTLGSDRSAVPNLASLKVRASEGTASVDGLNKTLALRLDRMVGDMPPELRNSLTIDSASRSHEHQKAIYDQAVAEHGPVEARRWAAKPGGSSHEHGDATDLGFGNNPAAVKWVHANAAKYGLYFPLSNENWHIEAVGGPRDQRGAANGSHTTFAGFGGGKTGGPAMPATATAYAPASPTISTAPMVTPAGKTGYDYVPSGPNEYRLGDSATSKETPSEVLNYVKNVSVGNLQGKTVFISSGAVNSPRDVGMLNQQIDTLTAKGIDPSSIKVVGYGSSPKLTKLNDQLSDIAQDKGVEFIRDRNGPAQPGTASVNPEAPQAIPTASPTRPTSYASPTVRVAPVSGVGSGDRESFGGKAMSYFMSKGWTRAQAAGIVGNLLAESGGRGTAQNPGDGADGSTSRGIAQWNGKRGVNLLSFAGKYGLNPADVNTQLQFVQWELENTETGAAARLKAAQNPKDAAAAIALYYERPAGSQTGVAENIAGWQRRLGHSLSLAGGQYASGSDVDNLGRQGVRDVDRTYAISSSLTNTVRRDAVVEAFTKMAVQRGDSSLLNKIPQEWLTPQISAELEHVRRQADQVQYAQFEHQRKMAKELREGQEDAAIERIQKKMISGEPINIATDAVGPDGRVLNKAFEYARHQTDTNLNLPAGQSQANASNLQEDLVTATINKDFSKVVPGTEPGKVLSNREIRAAINSRTDLLAKDKVEIIKGLETSQQAAAMTQSASAKSTYSTKVETFAKILQENPIVGKDMAHFRMVNYIGNGAKFYDEEVRNRIMAYTKTNGRTPNPIEAQDIYDAAAEKSSNHLKLLAEAVRSNDADRIKQAEITHQTRAETKQTVESTPQVLPPDANGVRRIVLPGKASTAPTPTTTTTTKPTKSAPKVDPVRNGVNVLLDRLEHFGRGGEGDTWHMPPR